MLIYFVVLLYESEKEECIRNKEIIGKKKFNDINSLKNDFKKRKTMQML